MSFRRFRPVLVLAAVAASAHTAAPAASPPTAGVPARGATVRIPLLDWTAPAPATWVSEAPSSSMRLAQFRVPGDAGTGEAEVVVFHFGQGQGGSAEANIARWESQFSSPEGKPVKATVQRLTASGMPVTTAQLTGTYGRNVGMGPGGAPKPDQALLAAVVETPKGNLFIQLHGPRATVAANRDAFLTMVRGITPARR